MGSSLTDFIGPVISESAFKRITSCISAAKADPDISILVGAESDMSEGYYVKPTFVETIDPASRFLREEIFGPFACLYVYEDADFGDRIFRMIDETTEYALCGSIFAKDRAAIIAATEELRFSAGNFYIKYVQNQDIPFSAPKFPNFPPFSPTPFLDDCVLHTCRCFRVVSISATQANLLPPIMSCHPHPLSPSSCRRQ